eukprot:TRINITY_DN1275_c0_g1_i1.p1 TRINITY_DN1275_c0_g1~~TRINITY_DN1275_c0_g1_i1.p1  ORF type:complete len:159 (-),score=2.81 TRINITY_DN1275_c0_g1_i1:73-549(-)
MDVTYKQDSQNTMIEDHNHVKSSILCSPFAQTNLSFEICTVVEKAMINSCGNMPVDDQKVASLGSRILSGGCSSSWEVAMRMLAPELSRARSVISGMDTRDVYDTRRRREGCSGCCGTEAPASESVSADKRSQGCFTDGLYTVLAAKAHDQRNATMLG